MRETAGAMMFSCVAILKCTGDGKTTDMEMTVMEEEVYTHRYLKTGCTACHAVSCRRHRWEEGRTCTTVFTGVLGEEMGEAG